MKRNILTLIIAVFALTQAAAQTYDNLWKQADIIARKDQPRSEIGVMKKIISKASAAKDYGQLMAAEMRQMILWKEISADSLMPNVERMEAEVLKVKDPALKAVRYAVLGKVYSDMDEKKSQEFFKKALEQPELLAKHTSTEYVPLTLKAQNARALGLRRLSLLRNRSGRCFRRSKFSSFLLCLAFVTWMYQFLGQIGLPDHFPYNS